MFVFLKEETLKIPGIKHKQKGNNKDVIKLINESLKRCIWVLTYIPQKHVI